MQRIKLKSDADLLAFKQCFERRAGNHVSLEYLRQSDVYAFRAGRELVAGYVIHGNHQHRFFDLMQQIGWEHIETLPGNQNDFCEITCMWMEPEARDFSLRVWFYTACTLNTFAKRKRYIIGGTKIAAVAQMQRYCLPHTLFEGDTENGIGSGHWTIYYGTPLEFTKGYGKLFVRESLKLVRTREVRKSQLN